MTEYENSNTIDRIFIEYLLEYSRTIIARIKSSATPKYGDIITLNNIQYRIVNTKYDYEVWQLTDDYHYTVNVAQIN